MVHRSFLLWHRKINLSQEWRNYNPHIAHWAFPSGPLLQPCGWKCAIDQKRMCAKNNTHILYMWRKQAIIEWSWHVISIVACCHSVKLCALAAQYFWSQHHWTCVNFILKFIFKISLKLNQWVCLTFHCRMMVCETCTAVNIALLCF